MENAIHFITEDETANIRTSVPLGTYLAELDYRNINHDDDYLNEMGRLFRFPVFELHTGHSWDGYYDWMTDLCWENDTEWMDMTRNGIILIIHGCDKSGYVKRFDPLLRHIIDSFVYDILPFWKKDVKDIVVEGESRAFSVYLVI